MKAKHGLFTGLKCRECGRRYPKEALHVCEFCFGPLEVDYDYDAIKSVLTRDRILSRSQTMWRYRELLPIDGEATAGFQVGFTPLVKADCLAKRFGLREVWVKNDTVNYPTLSFVHGAQAEGCAPIVNAVKDGRRNLDYPRHRGRVSLTF